MYRVEQTTKNSHDTATRLTDHTRVKSGEDFENELESVSYVSRT